MRGAILVFFCVVVLAKEMSAAPIKAKDENSAKRQSFSQATTTDPVQSVAEGPSMDGSYTLNDPYDSPLNAPCDTQYNPAACTGVVSLGQAQPNLFDKKVQLVGVKNLHIKNGKVGQPLEIFQAQG